MLCHISTRVKAECDKCGMVPTELHMPEHVHGWYCARCCPVCREGASAPQPNAELKPNAESIAA